MTFSKDQTFHLIADVDLEFFNFLKNTPLAQIFMLIPNPFAVFRLVARVSRNRRRNSENLRFFTIFLTHHNFSPIMAICGLWVFKMIVTPVAMSYITLKSDVSLSSYWQKSTNSLPLFFTFSTQSASCKLLAHLIFTYIIAHIKSFI